MAFNWMFVTTEHVGEYVGRRKAATEFVPTESDIQTRSLDSLTMLPDLFIALSYGTGG